MQQLGFRYVEAFVVTLFGHHRLLRHPDRHGRSRLGQVIRGFAPTVEIIKNPDMPISRWDHRRDGDAA
jgi:manganese transport protein